MLQARECSACKNVYMGPKGVLFEGMGVVYCPRVGSIQGVAGCILFLERSYTMVYADIEVDRRKRRERQRRNRDFGRLVREMNGCCICGESVHISLDFHHIDPSTKFAKGAMQRRYNSSLAKMKEEMELCVVICANCHRKLHADMIELPNPLPVLKFPEVV